MKSGLAPLLCGGMLALASAALAVPALAQPPAPQNAGGAPKVAAVDPATVQGLASARDYRPPQGIGFKATDFVSENVRLTAQWFYAVQNEGKKLPTVIIAHGWGGTAANFRQDAVDLARAGYLVMLFDYRGWGDSDGRVMLAGQRPAAGGTFTAQVRELRGYVDPWEQTEDWFNAISYATAHPMVDAERIGIRGSSYSGGHVIYVAAHEPRVKALVSQVSNVDSRPAKPYQPDPAKTIADANAAASRIAAGQAQYPADRVRVGGLLGAPVGNKVARWAPVEQAGRVTAPAQFIVAQNEELFSNTTNGQLACERVTGPRKMVLLPSITHYGIYGAERERAITAAIDWFDKYLKPAGAPTRVPVNRTAPERGSCEPPPEEELEIEGIFSGQGSPTPGTDKDGPSGPAGGVQPPQDASGRWN